MPEPRDTAPRPPGVLRGVAVVLAGLLVLAACASVPTGAEPGSAADNPPRSDEDDHLDVEEAAVPHHGGTLRVGTTGEPPHLDPHRSTDTLVLFITGHVYETLFTSDAEHRPVPLLAADHRVSDDELRHILTLRDDVRFHDGTPLTADDVVASLRRWASHSGLGASLLDATAELTTPDDHTVEFHLHEPYGSLPSALTRQLQAATIHPAHVLEASDATQLAEPIGTGPYAVEGWEPGRHLRLTRTDTYTSPDGPADGYAGPRPRYLDAIEFVPLPDEAARLAALRAGDVHLVESASPDQLELLDGDAEVVAELTEADVWLNLVLNRRAEAFAELPVRRALQLALDHDEILQAAVGSEAYELGPDLLPGVADYASDAGVEHYHPHEPDQARALLEEHDAVGTPLRLLTTLERRAEHNAALVIAQQLDAVGFDVDVQVLDGATLSSWRADETRYELYLASASFRPDPIMRNLTAAAGGWWEDERKDALLDQLRASGDAEERAALWAEVQEHFHQDVPRVKIGDLRRVVAHRLEVQGLGPTELQPDLSTVWLAP